MEIIITKNCPPNPKIFLVNEKRTYCIAGATSLYLLLQNAIKETKTNHKQGTPEKATAKALKLPEVVFVNT